MSRQRIDTFLVRLGLAESRSKAHALILAGEVTADGRPVSQPAMLVTDDAVVKLVERPPYVSRGGIKLCWALDRFGLDVTGKVAIDVGASTGGFTDCLLKQGAKK